MHKIRTEEDKDPYILDNEEELERIEFKFEGTSSFKQLSELGFRNGMNFVDIGCGGGAMTRLVKKLFPETKVAGIDSNKKRINYAVKLANELNLDIKYECANADSLPFKDNTFDFVWSRFLFEYLKQPANALAEMRRVTKKNGVVCAGDLDGNCVFHYPVGDAFKQKLQLVVDTLAEGGFDPFVGRKLFYYFKQAGFTNVLTKIFPYHNIAGKPADRTCKKWAMKVDSIGKFLNATELNKDDFIETFKQEFMEYIRSPNTFTYSSLIFVQGKK